MADRRLLVVSHSRSGGTAALVDAFVEGARDDAIDGVETRTVPALDATADDVRSCDALLLGTPENFGYMSGALKHFFDSVYYEILEETRGRPYGLIVKASTDGTGAVRAVERIVTGLQWRAFQEPVVAVGDLTDEHLGASRELGMAMAAALEVGIL